jgi:mRNA interferase MazF
MRRTIVVQITSNTSRQYLVDATHADWGASGLRLPSVINASNLATVPNGQVTHVIGALSVVTMQRIDACLKAALGLRE